MKLLVPNGEKELSVMYPTPQTWDRVAEKNPAGNPHRPSSYGVCEPHSPIVRGKGTNGKASWQGEAGERRMFTT